MKCYVFAGCLGAAIEACADGVTWVGRGRDQTRQVQPNHYHPSHYDRPEPNRHRPCHLSRQIRHSGRPRAGNGRCG